MYANAKKKKEGKFLHCGRNRCTSFEDCCPDYFDLVRASWALRFAVTRSLNLNTDYIVL